MTLPQRSPQELRRASLAAVREALARSQPTEAWQALQERDADGHPKGALPYTERALAHFAAAHEHDPDDIGIVHHLAIAHHARAWDMELEPHGDARAAGEWERALGYWRKVAASAEFWDGLKAKLLECEAQADPAWLASTRQNLLEDLLDVHVDFVRHYCETDAPDRATAHVDIVKRASLPPAVKKRLIEKVFAAMTGAVPEAKAALAYASALTSLERFLALFPNYLPALRMYAEICKEWVSGMSYRERWEDIVRLGERAEPYARRLIQHAELGTDPLARAALGELAWEFMLRSHDRAESYLANGSFDALSLADREAASESLLFGVRWGRLIGPYNSGDSSNLYAVCLHYRTLLLHNEALEVLEENDPTHIQAAIRLYQEAVAAVSEALEARPDIPELVAGLTQNRSAFQEKLSELEAQMSMWKLFGRLGGQP